MNIPSNTLVNEVSARQRVKPTFTIKTKQQLLAKDVFSPQITKFRRERIIQLYKDETWSADLVDKSLYQVDKSSSKYLKKIKIFINSYRFIH